MADAAPMGRSNARWLWMLALVSAVGLVAWVIWPSGQPPRQPGQQSALAERYTSSDPAPASVGEEDLGPEDFGSVWGRTGGTSTLVLYDTEGSSREVGEAETYAIAAGNLATHFGRAEAVPIGNYTPALMRTYDAVVYVGSSSLQEVPRAFYDDLLGGDTPVLWAGTNIDDFDGYDASVAARFEQNYGWDAAALTYTGDDPISGVSYHGRELTRDAQHAGQLAVPVITEKQQVEVLATTTEETPRPWAIRSDNLTYIGEIPLDFVNESDRYLAFADLFYDLLASDTRASRQAAIRLEGVDAAADPEDLRAVADYLHSQDIPFSVAVIPALIAATDDPESTDRIGLELADKPKVVASLKYMTQRGGRLIQHGTTHQFKLLDNPYDGSTGADFEFFRARCSATVDPPYQFETCDTDSNVVTTGPVGSDGVQQWVQRVKEGRALFAAAGLDVPNVFETPHDVASSNAYRAMAEVYDIRYERSRYFPGQLSGTELQQDRGSGQFFPYTVHDLYGSTVLPENLGSPTPGEQSGEVRDPQLLIDNAEKNLVVRESTASFAYHPSFGVEELRETVEGIQGLGYTFVPATELE